MKSASSNMIKKIYRNHCVFTGHEDLEELFTFSHFPVFMGCTTQSPDKDLFADMSWWISKSSGSIQLNPLIPLEVLYQDQHNESVGAIWQEHHQQFAEFIHQYTSGSIFEIGGAYGILAGNYQRINPEMDWTILEPNPRVPAELMVKVVKGFFDKTFSYSGKIENVVHSHLFEHIYEPREFVEALSAFIPVGKMLLFSLPNLKVLLNNKFTNALNFEHTIFLIEAYVDILLNNNGFKIQEKKYFKEHSIFYARTRVPDEKVTVQPWPDLYTQNKKIFMAFVKYQQDIVADLNHHIETSTGNIYLFGAHIFSQYLLHFGLKTGRLISVLDNSKQKQHKRLYGTRLKVDSPDVLKHEKGSVAVILKAGPYNNEIKRDILTRINPHIIFWE